jgi:hypothetical protein
METPPNASDASAVQDASDLYNSDEFRLFCFKVSYFCICGFCALPFELDSMLGLASVGEESATASAELAQWRALPSV